VHKPNDRAEQLELLVMAKKGVKDNGKIQRKNS
jgi:hypothetical protein